MRLRLATLVVVTVALVAVSPTWFASAESTASPATSTAMQRFDQHISHIVILMQENHAYDSLFGTYCLTTGTYCPYTGDGLPAKTCLPEFPYKNPAKPTCLKPFNFTRNQMLIPDMEHDWYSTHLAWNNGSMNGFWQAEGDTVNTMGHYNGSTVPVEWDTAEEYALADDFFSADASYSLPNHWFLVSAAPPAASQQNYIGWNWTTVGINHQYLNQSNATPTIEDELNRTPSVSWDYFDFGLGQYTPAISGGVCCSTGANGSAYDYWNPLAAREQSYQKGLKSHFLPRNDFFSDAANGTLPNISWVIPSVADSDHPGENLTDGENWTASVINALESSPDWNSSVLFITWDEYGGFYDQVDPPSRDAVGDGLRVPLLAVGPWVRQGYIDPNPMDFSSLLRLIELRFGLKCLGPADCTQKVTPLAMFNFNRKGGPRAPIQIPYWGNQTYPMPLQSSGLLPGIDPAGLPPPDDFENAPSLPLADPS